MLEVASPFAIEIKGTLTHHQHTPEKYLDLGPVEMSKTFQTL